MDLELDPISFLYIGILALLANLSVGTAVSYLLSGGKPAEQSREDAVTT